MNTSAKQIDSTTLDNLLYLSRLSPEATDRETLGVQVSQIVGYFEILKKFSSNEDPYSAYQSTAVESFRESDCVKTLEQADLQKMTEEFMDGYFRVPKVLGGGA